MKLLALLLAPILGLLAAAVVAAAWRMAGDFGADIWQTAVNFCWASLAIVALIGFTVASAFPIRAYRRGPDQPHTEKTIIRERHTMDGRIAQPPSVHVLQAPGSGQAPLYPDLIRAQLAGTIGQLPPGPQGQLQAPAGEDQAPAFDPFLEDPDWRY